ncbi:MAG: hypothetical protein BMS9Abin05_2748 [Rhodothermia bacterium]|nr:MAG: hypothetical protein BMS9Abin05_2748 [Rhodothermia bacterium]
MHWTLQGVFCIVSTVGWLSNRSDKIFSLGSERFLHSREGEPHRAYHEYLFKLRNVRERLHTEPAKRLADGREEVLKLFFEQLAAEASGRA